MYTFFITIFIGLNNAISNYWLIKIVEAQGYTS